MCAREREAMADGMDAMVFVSRSLSYSVIFLSLFMKLPQVLALYRAGSSRGISVRGYWLEIIWCVCVCVVCV